MAAEEEESGSGNRLTVCDPFPVNVLFTSCFLTVQILDCVLPVY